MDRFAFRCAFTQQEYETSIADRLHQQQLADDAKQAREARYIGKINWEAQAEGYWDCVVHEFNGMVSLSRGRDGWLAQIVGPDVTCVSQALFASAREAKAWVEQTMAKQFGIATRNPIAS